MGLGEEMASTDAKQLSHCYSQEENLCIKLLCIEREIEEIHNYTREESLQIRWLMCSVLFVLMIARS